MPRYFFHVWDGGRCIKDKDGCELSGLDEAKRELQRLAMMLPQTMQRRGVRLHVVDEFGEPVLEEKLKPQD